MKKMSEQITILIERKGKNQFTRFIELFKNRTEIPIKEVRSKVAKSSYYEFILNRIFTINETIKHINPSLESFIVPNLKNSNGKVVQTFKRNCNIEIIDEDPNFFYLKIKTGVEEKQIQ